MNDARWCHELFAFIEPMNQLDTGDHKNVMFDLHTSWNIPLSPGGKRILATIIIIYIEDWLKIRYPDRRLHP